MHFKLLIMIIISLELRVILSENNSNRYKIGVVIIDDTDSERIEAKLNSIIDKNLFELKIFKLNQTILTNSIQLTLDLCNNFISKSTLYTIITLFNENNALNTVFSFSSSSTVTSSQLTAATLTISYLCAYYQIPLLSIYNRESIFIDKTTHKSFIRLTPSYLNEAKIWIDLLKQFEFKSINFIHSSDDNGKFLAARFQYLTDQHDITLEKDIAYAPNDDNFTLIVRELALSTSKIIVLQAKPNDAEKIIKVAEESKLTEYGYVWIVTEEAFEDSSNFRLRNGFLTVRYSEQIDPLGASFVILKNAFERMNASVLAIKPPKNCEELGLQWSTGPLIYEEIIKQNGLKFETYSKDNENDSIIEFDDDGARLSAKYEILNVQRNKLEPIGYYRVNSNDTEQLVLTESKIIWPGNSKQKPDGTKWSMKLKIVTIEEKPFVFKFEKDRNRECGQMYTNAIECSFTYQNQTHYYCCYGYCIDLILKLSELLSFEFNVYLVPDGIYGDYDNVKKTWNGLMGEVTNDKADMILAPFTINPERANAVDFTKPFKYQGITILVKRHNKDSSFASFLQPFKETLWIMVILSVHVVAVVLYLLDRFSPFGRFKLSKTDNTEEDSLNLSRALWFTWGVLLNSGIGEGTPRSFSARVLGMVWAGFAMIMVASYTANLAAFLVLDRPAASISGINDARLRNPQDGFSYATVRGSAVEKYFKRQVELSTMYRTMENKNYNNTEEAIKALKDEKIQAFIWDSARLEYEASQSCEFVTTGELFGRSSYGLALKKGNPWLNKLSLCILSLHEIGYMEDLDSRWILSNNTSCQDRDSSPSTLGLTNMAGVFMLVAGGIIMGIFLIFIEIAYKRYKDKKAKQHEISRNAFATWRKNVEKRKLKKTSIDTSFINDVKSNNIILISNNSNNNSKKQQINQQQHNLLKAVNLASISTAATTTQNRLNNSNHKLQISNSKDEIKV